MTRSRILFVLNKVMQMIIMLIVLSVIVFAISRACPGDPLKSYYGDGVEHMSTEEKYEARERLGLNDPVVTQYFRWAGNTLEGDWGISYKYKRPVKDVIGKFWPNTLLLGGITLALIVPLSILLGSYCARREDTLADRVICKIGVISGSIPEFLLALVLLLLLAVEFPVFPTGGAYSYGAGASLPDRLWHLVLPVSAMLITHLWYFTYLVRNKLTYETRQDYVLLCKVKGLSDKQIIKKHCLRNIMPSLLTLLAVQVQHILGGTYVIEMVFSYPGLGKLSFESAKYQDYNMLMAVCLLTGAVVLVTNLIVQIVNEFIDPRMRHEERVVENV